MGELEIELKELKESKRADSDVISTDWESDVEESVIRGSSGTLPLLRRAITTAYTEYNSDCKEVRKPPLS